MKKTTLIRDNGAYEIKAGLSTSKTPSYAPPFPLTLNAYPRIIPNCIARSKGDRRVYIGSQLYNCKDYGTPF